MFKNEDEYQDKRRFVCWAGVWVTMMIFVPIMYTMYIKMYRVRKVFELYEEYLGRQRRILINAATTNTDRTIKTTQNNDFTFTSENSPRKHQKKQGQSGYF